ncbi:4-hydroxybenzoate polyprenyl transferase family protein [Xylariaceae sp. FL1019]|nr:4-hydroxybenzoate polyprenyl transferase family protein [Xylariaceae sp. FL1019]
MYRMNSCRSVNSLSHTLISAKSPRLLRHASIISTSNSRPGKGHTSQPLAVGFFRPTHFIPFNFTANNQRASHAVASSPTPPSTVSSSSSSSQPVPYAPPSSGVLSALPSSWVPYAELIRLDKPAGTWYLFFPCLFSTLLAAPVATASPLSVLWTSTLFLTGAIIMRGAGCSINDLWDRNLDPHVTRTRHRPIARGALTPFRALAFTGVQLFTGLGLLLQFPTVCLFYGIPSLLLVATYPLAKRVTYYPQFVLGLTFSWGAMMGFPALGVDLLAADAGALRVGAALLYASNVAWTVLYDMIYAHMDIRDDARAGIKSIALKHDADTRTVLTGLAVVQIGLLAGAGIATGAGPAFFIGSCGGAALTLGYMIKKVNLKNVRDCWWWFVHGCWITGGVISLGLGADYLIRYLDDAEVSGPEGTKAES